MGNLLNGIIKNISVFKASAADLVLDCLFPVSCAACGLTLDAAEKPHRLCLRCLGATIVKRSPEKIGNIKVYSPLDYRDPAAKNLISRLKYEYDRGAAAPLARFLIAHLKISGFADELGTNAVIVPVPLHKRRLGERGFNQTELIAAVVGRTLSLPVFPQAIKRAGHTIPQSRMEGFAERKRNVAGCFVPGKEAALIRGRFVVLLDDVWTSGSTMREAASVLRFMGAKKIIFVSVAFAG